MTATASLVDDDDGTTIQGHGCCLFLLSRKEALF